MPDRVVSLAPSATATIRAMGLGDRFVGGTLHGEHDATVVGGWLNPDLDRVDALAPDVVIAVDTLQTEIVAGLTARGHRTIHLAPTTLSDVFACVERLGVELDAEAAAHRVCTEMRARLSELGDGTTEVDRPVVYCEEWSDPPMVAGNWIPEIVDAAGGSYPFLSPGERSRRVHRDEVERHQPEHVILHICGSGESVDPTDVLERDWAIPAIERENVWVIDDGLLNQPAPSLVAGARAIHERLHPEPAGRPRKRGDIPG